MKRFLVLVAVMGLAAFSDVVAAEPDGHLSRLSIRTISVSATAEEFVLPDRAVVHLGAQAEAEDAAGAQTSVNATMQKVIGQLKQAGFNERDIRTSTLQLMPIYEREPSRSPREGEIRAYRAINSVRVQVNDPSRIGQVIDSGVKAGANRVESISFELQNNAEARIRALQSAIDKAGSKAEAIAQRLNLKIRNVHHVSEGENRVFPIDSGVVMLERAAFSPGAPVQPGEVRVEASVNVVYEIGPE